MCFPQFHWAGELLSPELHNTGENQQVENLTNKFPIFPLAELQNTGKNEVAENLIQISFTKLQNTMEKTDKLRISQTNFPHFIWHGNSRSNETTLFLRSREFKKQTCCPCLSSASKISSLVNVAKFSH